MRTTLDIDDDILQAAKELARAEKKTAGRMLSELARKGLTAPEAISGTEPTFQDGWLVLPRRGVTITKELVDRLIEEADLEEGRISLDGRREGE
jgi:hypothetical protein